MVDNRRTRVAVLGTLAEFHEEAIPFDMSGLLELVAAINPDLLCLDITPQQWRGRDFDKLPSNYRDALLPLARQTDIVVVPVGGEIERPVETMGGWRLRAVHCLRGWIRAIQRKAPGPEALNHGWRHDLVNTLYFVTRRLTHSDRGGGTGTHAINLTEQILAVSQRDPSARLLVVVNVQYCHLIRQLLRKHHEVAVTGFSEL